MTRPLPSLACLLAVAVLLPAQLLATTVQHFSTAELTLGADTIVEGECLSSQPLWINGTLVTSVQFQVSARLKGNPPSLISVVLPGGLDLSREVPVQVTFPGIPTMSPTQEMLLFLVPYTAIAGSYTILGMAQGKYSISTDTVTGTQARSDSSGATLATAAAEAQGRVHELKLDLLRQQIADLLTAAPPADSHRSD